MREATAKGPAIDLTEFERRMRGPQSSTTRGPDPLKELARLVHGNEAAPPPDPYGEMFAEEPARSAPASRRPESPARAEPSYYPQDEGYGDLRGSYDAAAPTGRQAQRGRRVAEGYQKPASNHKEPAYHDQVAYEGEASYNDTNPEWAYDESQAYLDYGEQDEAAYADEPQSRRRFPKFRTWHAVAGIAVLGVASIGWTFAHRSGGSIAPQQIATIAAPDGPAKVPPAATEAPQPEQGAAVLDRSSETAAVKKVVTSEEQPVDPAVAPKALRMAAASADAPRQQSESLVPAPARKVKTISVRPDGSVIANDAVPSAVVAKPPRSVTPIPADPAEADDQGGTPKIAEKPATTPRAAKPTAKPAKVAVGVADPPEAVDDAAQAAPTGSVGSGRSFAVQFGAAGSEAEAREMMNKVASKYAGMLGGGKLGFHHAKVGDKTVFRVRAAGMTKDSAVAVCEKVKAAGGNCFVAAN
jgi:hypothetical protein